MYFCELRRKIYKSSVIKRKVSLIRTNTLEYHCSGPNNCDVSGMFGIQVERHHPCHLNHRTYLEKLVSGLIFEIVYLLSFIIFTTSHVHDKKLNNFLWKENKVVRKTRVVTSFAKLTHCNNPVYVLGQPEYISGQNRIHIRPNPNTYQAKPEYISSPSRLHLEDESSLHTSISCQIMKCTTLSRAVVKVGLTSWLTICSISGPQSPWEHNITLHRSL